MPPRIKAAERRELILQRVTPLFAERGYDGATTRALGQAAQVSEALVFQHWASKAAIYRDVLDRVAGSLEERLLAAAPADLATDERLEQFARAWLETATASDSSWMVFTWSVSDDDLADHQRSIREAAVVALSELLTGSATKRGRRGTARAEALLSAAVSLAVRARQEPHTDRKELVAALADFGRAARAGAPGPRHGG